MIPTTGTVISTDDRCYGKKCQVLPDGTIEWYLNGELHREDGPAIIKRDGTKAWYQYGQRHRTDGPALEYPNGFKRWYRHGKCHRVGGPAVEWKDGSKEWWLNGKFIANNAKPTTTNWQTEGF